MNETINIKIITPLKVIVDTQAKMVVLPGQEGIFGVLRDHAPLIASLKEGVVKVFIDNINEPHAVYFVSGGIAEVTATYVNIVTEHVVEETNSNTKQS